MARLGAVVRARVDAEEPEQVHRAHLVGALEEELLAGVCGRTQRFHARQPADGLLHALEPVRAGHLQHLAEQAGLGAEAVRGQAAAVAGALAHGLQGGALDAVVHHEVDGGLGELAVGERGAVRLLATGARRGGGSATGHGGTLAYLFVTSK